MDGRGLVASLALGAAGALLGTRFMVARESGTFQAYQQRMFAAKETDTVVTRSFSGRPARSIRNGFIEEYHKSRSKPLAWPLQPLAADDFIVQHKQIVKWNASSGRTYTAITKKRPRCSRDNKRNSRRC
jgi:NAD(P)H-dependent flavin oxidoreductase YrpB (nitropropane dioxygenase family)